MLWWVLGGTVVALLLFILVTASRDSAKASAGESDDVEGYNGHPAGCECFDCKPYGLSGDSPRGR